MKNLFNGKLKWLGLLILLILVNILANQFHGRLDLTKEKRYTLSAPTKKILSSLKNTVTITVVLEGEMPAGFKNLRNRAQELLEHFKEQGGNRIQFKFVVPGEEAADGYSMDSLVSMGLQPTNVKVKAKKGTAEEQRYLFPGALVAANGKQVPVDFLEGQDMTGGLQSINNAEALLEYKFLSAIQKVTTDQVPLIGYLVGNGEPLNYNVYNLIEGVLKPNYRFSFLPIDSVPVIPDAFDALLVVKPTQPFSEGQKLKLDQYVMRGGKMIWMVDRLFAEMDSLMRKQSDFVAFDRGLNLDDLFFKFGVRINGDLLQDLQCDQMPMVVGSMGDQPQMQLTNWPYFPLLNPNNSHIITQNLNKIASLFPNSIDTLPQQEIQKTILLSSSQNARVLSTPAMVSLNSVKTEDDLKTFQRSFVPVAVLLEGTFTSLYNHRLSTAALDSLQQYQHPFIAHSEKASKMIIASDADLVTNVVTQQEGPLEMGLNQFTKTKYANKEFLLNSIEYLVNPNGVLETRAKDYTLRLLDPKLLEEQKTFWQVFNLTLPILLVALFGGLFQYLRKRKFA